HYRAGAGSTGNIAGGIERNLDKLHSQIRKIPKPKRKGSSDVGVLLLETLSTVNDLLSLYQDGVSREAQLDKDDRKRISKREKRVEPKLKELVRFCEKVEPRTMGQMGISVSDIQKIKTAAIKVLQMTKSALCSKCGAMNRPEASRCLKCGRSL
ncbi:MAG: zinc ribbon domain-containing protein, partial [Candidatus Thorarchaeota archaeon]